MAIIDEVKQVLGDVLQISDTVGSFTLDSGLLGSIPEFDSMAVVGILTALEESYGFEVDDDEIEAETFETVGSLVAFVESKL